MSSFCHLFSQVARLLDPDRAFFGDRVVSRDDCPDLQGRKSLERLFPGGIEMALILDDSPHVWQVRSSRLRMMENEHK